MPSDAEALAVRAQLDHFVRVVAARAGEHRHLPRRLFDGDPDYSQMLVARERRAFAGGPARDQKIDALSI